MIALVIATLLLAGALATFLTFSRGARVTMEHADHSASVQFAFEYVIRQLLGVSEVHVAGATSFEFSSIGMDGVTDRIRLYYDAASGELRALDVDLNTERVLLSDVTQAQFIYYDRHGAPTNTQIDINAAKLALETERATTTGVNDVATETAIITFRNRIL